MTEKACDLDCPVRPLVAYIFKRTWDGSKWVDTFQAPILRPLGECCSGCAVTRKDLVTEENKHLWDDWLGFRDVETGCRLSREDMPEECRKYDCKTRSTFILKMKIDGKFYDICSWKKVHAGERFVF